MGIFFGAETRANSLTFAEPPVSSVYGGSPYGGAKMSIGTRPDTALAVPTVWACVALLANAVSMLPLETFRKAADGVPRQLADPSLLINPSGDMTQSEWLHMVMVSLLLRGNAYGAITARDANLRATQIDIFSPDAVKVDIDRDTGKITYKVGVNQKIVPNDQMWHVRGMTLPGAKIGLSPIAYAAQTLGIDLSARQFADDFFAGGGIPKAVLETDQSVNQEQARTIKERLLAATNRREPMVLGAGLKYTAISVRPEESQFLMTLQANKAQIADFFSIPAGMVGGTEGNGMTYSNREQRGIDFLTYSVSFWLKRIEDATTVLLPRPQYTRFDTSALLRTDAETRAKVHVQLLAGKVMAPSEVRQTYDLPPMTQAQKEESDLVPLTITPLGGAKALPGIKELPGPSAPVPADDQSQQNNSASDAILTLAAAVHHSATEQSSALSRMADAVIRTLRVPKSVTKTIERDGAGNLLAVKEEAN